MKTYLMLLLAGLVSVQGAWARGGGGGYSGSSHDLSVASGLTLPSGDTALLTNPAGMIYNFRSNLSFQGGTNDSSLTQKIGRVGLNAGDGTYGLGVLGSYDSVSTNTRLNAGMAVFAPSIATSVGLAMHTGLSPSGGTSYDLGALIGAYSRMQIGVKAYGVEGGIDYLGGGVALAIDSAFSFACDVAMNKSFKNIEIQPAMLIGSPRAALTVSYGLPMNADKVMNKLAYHFTTGASYRLNPHMNFQFYYKQFEQYTAALTYLF